MNHLAHFHLAGGSEPLVVGALLGDYIKGPLDGRLNQALELGVRLHRQVDAFTDGHPLLRQLRTLFPGKVRRLAGVVLDMYFDHLLVHHWSRFHEQELAHFSRSTYAILGRNRAQLPASGAQHLSRMIEHDLLTGYGDLSLIEGVLERIGTRLGQSIAMLAANERARTHLGELEETFLVFYPEAITMARRTALSAAR